MTGPPEQTQASVARMPIHLAAHVPGSALQVDGAVRVSSRVGPLLSGLARRVERLTVVAYEPPPHAEGENRTDYTIESTGAVVDLVSLGPRGTWRTFLTRRRRVAAVVRSHSAAWDVLFFQLVNRRAWLVARAARSVRWVAQIGGHTPSVVLAARGRTPKGLIAWGLSLLPERDYRRIGRGGVFLVNAETLHARYERKLPHATLIRTSARPERFHFRAEDRMNGPTVNLCVIGRLTPAKGVLDALEAFALVRQELPQAVLHFVGDGDGVDLLRQRASGLGLSGSIHWHGWIPSGPALYDLLKSMDVMLTLSRAEGLPKTVPEAMAHSVLVVATPAGSTGVAFSDEAELMLVPFQAPEAAARAVLRLAREEGLRRRLIEGGYNRARSLTVESVAEQILEEVRWRWPEVSER